MTMWVNYLVSELYRSYSQFNLIKLELCIFLMVIVFLIEIQKLLD